MTKRTTATSYDEIVRATVPEIDVFAAAPQDVAPADSALEARIRAALAADTTLAKQTFEVFVREARARLVGRVCGSGTAGYAADVARRVPGIAGVDNELVADPAGRST